MNRVVLLALVLFIAGGCGGPEDPAKHPLLLKAAQYRKDGNFELAEKFYSRFIVLNPDSAIGHRALGTLYDESLADPAAALYCYNRYLKLAPEAPDRELIIGYRQLVRAKLLRDLSRENLPTPPDDQLAQLQKENVALRRQLESIKQLSLKQQQLTERLKRALKESLDANAALTGTQELRYVVQSGDTLGQIARKFYGSASYYSKILEANNLDRNAGLRAGQVLKIPALKEIREKKP